LVLLFIVRLVLAYHVHCTVLCVLLVLHLLTYL